ncbi:MAG: ribosomal-processing cysteine protease Prp [Lachnospiraceae bacterium]|nr:ribosomal-processing cysteine protease Prp [Lachnospiraceae bacterium]
MTKIVFFRSNGKYTGMEAKGHAMYDSYGKDIVCSAMSVLITNTVNAIDEINHEEIDLTLNEEDGLLSFRIINEKEESTQVLMKALVLGLESIQKEYGKKYCKVDYKEEMQNVKA